MGTRTVALRLPFVALAAVHRLGSDIVIGVLLREVRMATDAGIGLVRRGGQFGGVDKQRDLLTRGIGLSERLVRMAFQAGAVLDFRRLWLGICPWPPKHKEADADKRYPGQQTLDAHN